MKVFVILSLITILSTSCGNYRILSPNHNESLANREAFEYLTKTYEHIIQPDDKLSLSIWNHDDLSIGSAYSIYNTNEGFGKWILVERDSMAALPFIGDTKVGGMTLSEAEIYIAAQLEKTIKNPIVEVKVLNREVTILGEVGKPGNYILEKNLNSLIEVIGRANGFTSFSNPKKIMVIRDSVGCEFNFSQLSEYDKNNILLKNGDIVYIPPKRIKNVQLTAPVLIPFASFITSIAVLVSLKQ